MRHRAAELGLALADISGTGTHGRVTRKDVERAAAARGAPKAAVAGPGRPGHRRRGATTRRTGDPGGAVRPGRVTPYARRLARSWG